MSTLGIFRTTHDTDTPAHTQDSDPHAKKTQGEHARIQVRLLNDEGDVLTELSTPFAMDQKRYSFPLRLLAAGCAGHDPSQPLDEAEVVHVVCIIRRYLGANFIKIVGTDPQAPRYLISNKCVVRAATIHVWQTRGSRGRTSVKPFEDMTFGWDDPEFSKYASFCVQDQDSDVLGERSINLKIAGQEGSLLGGKILWSTSIVFSHTRLLEFTDAEDELSPASCNAMATDIGSVSEVVRVSCVVQGIGLSIVNQHREEVLYATLTDMHTVFRATDKNTSINISVSKLQIDNQSRLGPPVALLSPFESGPSSKFLQAQLERNMTVKSMAYWNVVSVKMGKLCVDVYEAWLHELLAFECLAQPAEIMDDERLIDVSRISPLTGQMNANESILERLSFLSDESVHFNQTFFERLEFSSFEGTFSLRGLSSAVLRDKDSHGPFAAIYEHLTHLGQTGPVPDVRDHTLKLPALDREDLAMAGSSGGVKSLMWKHYKHVLFAAVARMLVSNAVWMLENFGDSQSQQLRKQNEDAREASEQINGIGQGLKRGFDNFGGNLLEGLTGVISKPLDGARDNGFLGFFQGVGAGAIGVVSKPFVAVAEFGQIVVDALDTDERRIRLPRAVYGDRLLRRYVYSHALALSVLKDEEAVLRREGKQRLADRIRKMRRSFVSFVPTDSRGGADGGLSSGGHGRHGGGKCVGNGVLVADGKILLVGPSPSEVQQEVALKAVRHVSLEHDTHQRLCLRIVTTSNSTLRYEMCVDPICFSGRSVCACVHVCVCVCVRVSSGSHGNHVCCCTLMCLGNHVCCCTLVCCCMLSVCIAVNMRVPSSS